MVKFWFSVHASLGDSGGGSGSGGEAHIGWNTVQSVVVVRR